MKKRYTAFTLVEMLIVMGIIIILMAVGIASGRFAIRRANKIEHQNAAENIYQAAQSYYADHKEFPISLARTTPSFGEVMGVYLSEYIDDFNGGSEASYGYAVDKTGQVLLICVTYGGKEDLNRQGIYCTGNGMGLGNVPTKKDISYSNQDYSDYNYAVNIFEISCANWDSEQKDWIEDGSLECQPDEMILEEVEDTPGPVYIDPCKDCEYITPVYHPSF